MFIQDSLSYQRYLLTFFFKSKLWNENKNLHQHLVDVWDFVPPRFRTIPGELIRAISQRQLTLLQWSFMGSFTHMYLLLYDLKTKYEPLHKYQQGWTPLYKIEQLVEARRPPISWSEVTPKMMSTLVAICCRSAYY